MTTPSATAAVGVVAPVEDVMVAAQANPVLSATFVIGTVKPNSVGTAVPRAIGKAGAIGVTEADAPDSAEVPPWLSAVAVKVWA